MKYLIATLAASVLFLAASGESHASKGYNYGGYAGYGGYGHGYGHGYGNYGHGHGYCPTCNAGGHWGHHHYHGFHYDMYNVPTMSPPPYQAGPPSAAVTYPYYTTRGPRDFLQDGCGPNPILPYRRPHICLPSIGP